VLVVHGRWIAAELQAAPPPRQQGHKVTPSNLQKQIVINKHGSTFVLFDKKISILD
jgi:hypothetical protein